MDIKIHVKQNDEISNLNQYSLILDAIFGCDFLIKGFSFKGEIKSPYKEIINVFIKVILGVTSC